MNENKLNPYVYHGKGWIIKRMTPKQYQNWIKASQIITVLAFVVLLGFYMTKLFHLGINRSASIDAKVFFANKLEKDVKRGDLVTFKFYGDHYPHGMSFTKYIAGMPGDVVTVDENKNYFVNGQFVGQAKEESFTFEPLEATHFRGVIPPGKFWYYTKHPDSFDSRYQMAGLGDLQDVVGKTYIVF